MKAMVMREFGGPDVLEVRDVAVRSPGPGEALIQVSAVSVGRLLDIAARAGKLPFARIEVPHVLGAEHVGVVAELGPAQPATDTDTDTGTDTGLDPIAVGDRVAVFPVVSDGTCPMCLAGHEEACPNLEIIGIHRQGAYAAYTTVPVRQLHRVPADISDVQACALTLAGPVSRRQLDAADVQPGAWVLVQAAGSALGACAAMLAAFGGARVVGTTRHEDKLPALRRLDVGGRPALEAALNWQSPTFVDDVLAMTGGRGVDVVIDNIGDPAMFLTSTAVLASGGVLVSSGAFAGGSVTVDLQRLYLRNQRILGVRTGNRDSVRRFWADVARGFRTVVDTTYPVTQAAQAHRYVEQQSRIGRVVLTADWTAAPGPTVPDGVDAAVSAHVGAPEPLGAKGSR